MEPAKQCPALARWSDGRPHRARPDEEAIVWATAHACLAWWRAATVRVGPAGRRRHFPPPRWRVTFATEVKRLHWFATCQRHRRQSAARRGIRLSTGCSDPLRGISEYPVVGQDSNPDCVSPETSDGLPTTGMDPV